MKQCNEIYMALDLKLLGVIPQIKIVNNFKKKCSVLAKINTFIYTSQQNREVNYYFEIKTNRNVAK